MYNRYIRNDDGAYTRIPQEDGQQQSPKNTERPHAQDPQKARSAPPPPHPPSSGGGSGRCSDGLSGILQHILDQLHLDHVDTGDLLLLVLLFFLSQEDADEELLMALGLLLIL